MKTIKTWKPAARLDNALNILVIVLALGVLGLGSFETEAPVTVASAAAVQRA